MTSPFQKGKMNGSSGSGGKFFKIKSGETKQFAFCGELEDMVSCNMHNHWGSDPFVAHPCIGEGCPSCAIGNKKRETGFMNIVDKQGNVMIFSFGNMIYKQILQIEKIMREEVEENGTKGDPIIKGLRVSLLRQGSGLKTKYMLTAMGTGYIDVDGLELHDLIESAGVVEVDKINEKLKESGLIADGDGGKWD